MIWTNTSSKKAPLRQVVEGVTQGSQNPPPKGRLISSIAHEPPNSQRKDGYIMKNLIETAKNTHVPGKYDLRESELDFLYNNYRYDLFGLISFVFKLGFARGQKAGEHKCP
ncbi:MAG: hypothetical protein KHW69_02795 [Clostridium sp.]|nr:hypothetical protein [Clostridium sp.]